MVVDRKEGKWTLVEFSFPIDMIVNKEEHEKVEKYQGLVTKILKMYRVRTEIHPIITGALETISKRLPGYLKDLGVPDMIRSMQISILLGTIRNIQREGQLDWSSRLCRYNGKEKQTEMMGVARNDSG